MNYSDINVGDKAQIVHLITQQDIEKFVDLTGDDNRLHVDKDFASKTSFKKPVVHGMISASFISTIIGTRIPGDGALWYEQSIEFLLPVRIGDEITVVAEVVKKVDRLQSIELKTEVFNQNKQKVISGVAKVKVTQNTVETEPNITSTAPKVALIVGSSGGIGSTTAMKLAEAGFDIGLHYFSNKNKAESLKKKIEEKFKSRVVIVQGDIVKKSGVDEIVDYVINRLGDITVLVNSATIHVPNIKFEELSWEDFQSQLDVHLKSFFNLAQKLAPVMEKYKYGKIVSITTQAIEYPFSDLSPYIAAKSALAGLSKSLALDLAKKGIRVNMVSPGITDTELNADLPEKAKLLTASRTPLKRLASTEDVANTISYLCSPQSDFITGETIRVNGGQLMM